MPQTLDGLRRLTTDDAEPLLALVEACDIDAIGEPDYSIEDVEDDLSRPTWQGWGLPGPEGRFRAYCWVERRAADGEVHADVRVHPGESAELGELLLDRVRAEARRVGPGHPVHVFTAAASARDRGWLEAAGGRVIRHYWRMGVRLPETRPPAPVPPAGVLLRRPADDPDELRILHRVVDTAFLDHFGSAPTDFDEWHHRQRTSPGADLGLWWLATVDGEPAAALIGRAWPEMGWVQGLGTLREFRGRGLGRLLLLTSFAEFHRRGYRRVGLSVDAANPTGAVGLYESVGMTTDYEAVRYELAPLGG